MQDETELIHRLLVGDLGAFELLVTQYQRLVYTVVNRMLDNKEDSEDICQEVFMKVHKSLGTFKFQSKFSTWIARVAYLTAISHLGKKKKQGLRELPEELELTISADSDPGTIMEKKDLQALVNALVEQMPLQYKTVLTLFHIHEFSHQEIQGITGWPEGTVKGYLFRARKLLKEKIESQLKKEYL